MIIGLFNVFNFIAISKEVRNLPLYDNKTYTIKESYPSYEEIHIAYAIEYPIDEKVKTSDIFDFYKKTLLKEGWSMDKDGSNTPGYFGNIYEFRSISFKKGQSTLSVNHNIYLDGSMSSIYLSVHP